MALIGDSVYNPWTGELDKVLSATQIEELGFVPYADGASDLYYKKNGYTLELWFKGVMVTSYTIDAPTTGVGQPIGLLLTLTYAA